MTHDDIQTEAHRLGELESAFIRLANEFAHDRVNVNRELVDLATRLDVVESAVRQPRGRWWLRLWWRIGGWFARW